MPIPRLILGRAESIPLPDRSVQRIIVERTPLRRQAYLEINRVIAVGGIVILRHACPPGIDPHRLAYELLDGQIEQSKKSWHNAVEATDVDGGK